MERKNHQPEQKYIFRVLIYKEIQNEENEEGFSFDRIRVTIEICMEDSQKIILCEEKASMNALMNVLI